MHPLKLIPLFLAAATLPAQVLFVDGDHAVGGNGTSWATAFRELRDALSVAQPGTTIWVAEGRYRPGDGNAAATATFLIPDGVAVYGGFGGSESSLAQRDWELHTTWLDADLLANDVLARTDDNVHRVVTLGAGGSTARLDGFVVRGARAGSQGGGIYVPGGAPTVAHCVIEDNFVSASGGGVYLAGGSATFVDCVFSFNRAASGGGVFAAGSATVSTVTFDHCAFVGNSVVQVGALSGDGGGLFAEASVDLDLISPVVLSNTAQRTVPATIAEGGGICSMGGTVTIQRGVFQGNTADMGGGVFATGTMLATHVIASHNRVVDVNNLPAGRGGAFWAQNGTLEGCTVVDNYAEKKGGGAIVANGFVRNCIFWGNTIALANIGSSEPLHTQVAGGPDISYSDVEGIFTPLPGCPPPNPLDFPGCIEADPMFVDGAALSLFPNGMAASNLRLANGSPCIDAANNAAFTLPLAAGDINGKPRFYDDPATPNSGAGSGALADMGAYEHGPWLNDLPMASFQSSMPVVTATFVDTSTSPNGAMRLEVWEFGDGLGSCVPRAVHHYASNAVRSAQLRVFDVALATVESSTQVVVPSDLLPPVVQMIEPINGANITGTVMVRASATDNDIVASVEFLLVGVSSLGIDLEGDSNDVFEIPTPWNTALMPDGFYTLKARAADAVGNISEATVTVHIVNQAPVYDCVPAPIDLRAQIGETLVTPIRAMGLQPMTYTVLSGPVGMTISNPGNGARIAWTPGAGDLGLHTAVVRASNASGLEDVTLTLEVVPVAYLIESFMRPGVQKTVLTGINDLGTMTGWSTSPGAGVNGFVTDGSTFTNLHAPQSFWTFAHGINNLGVVCGSLYTVSGYGSPGWRTLTWQNGVFSTSIYPLSSSQTDAYGINDAGLLVGRSFAGAYGPSVGWATFSPPVTLLPPGAIVGTSSRGAFGCNDVDQVIGSFNLGGGNVYPQQVFVYDHPTDTYQVHNLPGVMATAGRGINDAGYLCGTYATCAGLSQDGAFVSRVPQPGPGDWLALRVPGSVKTQAWDINDSNVVVGQWDDANSIYHGFIARPASAFEHTDLGFGGPGTAHLSIVGHLGTGNTATLYLTGAPAATPVWIVMSLQAVPTPFVGGTIVTLPAAAIIPTITDSQGNLTIAGIPGGGGPLPIYVQCAYGLPGGPQGYGLTNAVEMTLSQ